jgi:hypothetical protein
VACQEGESDVTTLVESSYNITPRAGAGEKQCTGEGAAQMITVGRLQEVGAAPPRDLLGHTKFGTVPNAPYP